MNAKFVALSDYSKCEPAINTHLLKKMLSLIIKYIFFKLASYHSKIDVNIELWTAILVHNLH